MDYQVDQIAGKQGYSFIARKYTKGRYAIVCIHKYDATSPEITEDIKKELEIELNKLHG